MRLALVTDTHWGARNDSLAFLEFFKKFYANIFIPTLRAEQIDTVVMLGDTFDRRKYTNHVSLSCAKRSYFDSLRDLNIRLHMIVGNHDTAYKNTNRVNAPDLFLREYPNITIYESPQVVEFDGVPILCLPWICDENRDASMQLIREAPVSLIFGHLEISGFEMDKGLMCTEGLSASTFDRFEMVMSGHFHHRSTRGPIYYLGNPYEITWADYEDPRGFHLFDTETRALTFIPNPYRMFYKLIYDDTAQTFETWQETDFSQYTDTCVKVVVRQKNNPYLFDSVLDRLYAATPQDVTIVENYLSVSEQTEESTIDQGEHTMAILSKYIDGLQLDVDASQLKRFMGDLYHDAISSEQDV